MNFIKKEAKMIGGNYSLFLSIENYNPIMASKIGQNFFELLSTKKSFIFVPTVLATLPNRTASQGESFAKKLIFKIIHLPCLSMKHTWKVFSF